jgi:hypothetical protein
MSVGSSFLKTDISKKHCKQWKQKQGQVIRREASQTLIQILTERDEDSV